MKKLLPILLALFFCLSLCACGQSEAAKAVDAQISAIGEITLESEALIIAAEQAVSALSTEDRESLKNASFLQDARNLYDTLVLEANVSRVEEIILTIGEVTLDSDEAITAAEQAVSELTEEEKAQLNNITDLENARYTYETLVLESKASKVEAAISAIGTVTLDSGERIKSARAAFTKSEEDVQKLVSNLADLEAAEITFEGLQIEQASALIDAIGEVTINSGDVIEAAQTVYDKLSAQTAAKVSNAGTLALAKIKYKELKFKQAQSLLDTFRVDTDAVNNVKFYFSTAQPKYSNERSFVFPSIGINANNKIWLCAQFLYTGDSWVFFKKITFSIDGENTVKTFDYFDVVRDNDRGDVWECISTADGNQYEQLFWDIANSKTTIVRFEGDDYYYDMTVSQEDKNGIRDVLNAFEGLKIGGYKVA